jgi:nucleotide-binding universal stress UspA family protein
VKRIVVVADVPSGEPRVVDAAAELAGATGAEVVVVAVDDVESQRFATRPRESYLDDAAQSADAAVERLTAAGVAATREVRSGRAVDEVLAAADQHNADAIVVGARPRGRVAGAVLGDIALRLLQRSKRPVVVVTTG